jgi:hypothetical protein
MAVAWTNEDIKVLNEMAGSDVKDIAKRLGRSSSSVRWKISHLDMHPVKPPPAPIPALDQCAWLSGDTKPYTRCTNKAKRGAWCEDHWKITHAYRSGGDHP